MKLNGRLLGIGLLGSAVFTGCAPVSDADVPLGQDDVESSAEAGTKKAEPLLSGRVIVKFRDTASGLRGGAMTQETLAARALRNRGQIDRVGGRLMHQLVRINAVSAELTAAQVAALQKDDSVLFVERDPVRAPFLPTAVNAITPQAESVPYGITLVQADQVSDANIANRKVCIVDTGYDGTHEDLRPAPNTNVTGNDNDGLGSDTGDWFRDGYGHGTHVAGTISALRSNGKGVVGVTGSNGVGLHIVKVFADSGSWAYGSDLVVAVEQCVNAGANVISMSLGGSESSAVEQAAFEEAYAAGVLSIAAAGNGGNTALSYPASYDVVMSVAAINSAKARASFSQRNAQVEISAPGVAVLSTTPGNGYESWDGTSMATPHVSGVAALVWSQFPTCPVGAIRNALDASAEDLGTAGRDTSFGYGLVRAKAAVDYLTANGCTIVEPPPPPPPPADEELLNGTARTGLGGDAGDTLGFFVKVPAGATNLSIALSGGTGDGDLYVKFGSAPTTASYDCRPYLGGNAETCTFAAPSAGTYFVKVIAYSAFSGASLRASYTTGSTCASTTLTATGLPVSIPDNNATGVRSTISSGVSGNLSALNVKANITHTYRGDLVVTLIAPSGAQFVLSNRAGGSADNLAIDANVPSFAGLLAAGNFQLLVQDRAAQDVGTLTSFQLAITPTCN